MTMKKRMVMMITIMMIISLMMMRMRMRMRMGTLIISMLNTEKVFIVCLALEILILQKVLKVIEVHLVGNLN